MGKIKEERYREALKKCRLDPIILQLGEERYLVFYSVFSQHCPQVWRIFYSDIEKDFVKIERVRDKKLLRTIEQEIEERSCVARFEPSELDILTDDDL